MTDKKLQIRNSTAEFLIFTKQAGEEMSLLAVDNIMSDMYKFLDPVPKVIFSVLDGETKNFEMSMIIN